jgi:hypothetical protein
MSLRMIQLLAILLTTLALIPAGAHLFELPNKIDPPRIPTWPLTASMQAGLGSTSSIWLRLSRMSCGQSGRVGSVQRSTSR